MLEEIIRSSSVYIDLYTSSGGWNNEIYLHSVVLYLPEEIISVFEDLESQLAIADQIRDDLNKCISINYEAIEKLTIEIIDENEQDYKDSIKVYELNYSDNVVKHIWKPNYIKLFISHKDKYKKEVSELKKLLEPYGIICFIAHEAIIPLSEWENELRKALFTMDVLLVYITDDFSESQWTDQEVGIAVGRNVPIIPLKIQSKDPYGFIAKYQAIKYKSDKKEEFIKKILNSIAKSCPYKFITALVEVLIHSTSFIESANISKLLLYFKNIDQVHINIIMKYYSYNRQIHGSFDAKKNIIKLLEKHTGKFYITNGNKIEEYEMLF